MQRIVVAGVGPGTADMLTPAAGTAIERAGALVGGKRHVDLLARENQMVFVLKNNLDRAVEFIHGNRHLGVVVMASGDPGMFGILSFLRRHFSPSDLEVIPGISSFQLAFARLAMPWQDALLLSVHGREPRHLLEHIRQNPKVAVLTGPEHPPERVIELMLEAGITRRHIHCCCDLSYPRERLVEIKPGELSSGIILKNKLEGVASNCVMVILDEK